MNRTFLLGLTITAILTLAGCLGSSDKEVVVYVALDKEFSEPILQDFEKETGIRVLAKYDVESNKTVGLANELLDSTARTKADVFWNNEILHTLRLEQAKRLESYSSTRASDFPDQFVSSNRQWFGFAARARVLIVNTTLLPDPQQRPSSILDLADPKWKGNCGMAKPFFGTTATQAAVLFAEMPEPQAIEFFQKLANNCQIEGGNKQVAKNVAAGRYAWGLTDTDDAVIELERGESVILVFPDQGPDQAGTLLIPNSLCILKNAPHRDHARTLIDYLLRPEIEQRLNAGSSAQIPLSQHPKEPSRIAPANLKIRQVDFDPAARKWDSARTKLFEIFK